MGSLKPSASFRLKSRRRGKRLQKKNQEKYLLTLHREENKIRKQIWNLGYEPLTPPVQKGYRRIFVLHEDVSKSAEADFFTHLLEKINTVQYSDTKDFTQKKRRRGRKIQVPREQKLRDFYEWEYKELTEAEAFYFKPVMAGGKYRKFEMVYQFTEPWRYVLKIIPNIITQAKIKDQLLEQKVDEISNYLKHDNRRSRLTRLLGKSSSYWWRTEKNKYKNALENKPLSVILTELEGAHPQEKA